MPDVTIFEQNNIEVEELRTLLDRLQTVDAVRTHLKSNGLIVSNRTIRRFISGKLVRRYCWFPITTITTSATTSYEEAAE